MNHKQYTNIVFTFLFGGLIVILVSLISDHVSNNIALLLWAFPFTVIPTLCYFYLQNKSSKHISDFLLKIMFSVCLLFFNILILYYVYKLTNNFIDFIGNILFYIRNVLMLLHLLFMNNRICLTQIIIPHLSTILEIVMDAMFFA